MQTDADASIIQIYSMVKDGAERNNTWLKMEQRERENTRQQNDKRTAPTPLKSSSRARTTYRGGCQANFKPSIMSTAIKLFPSPMNLVKPCTQLSLESRMIPPPAINLGSRWHDSSVLSFHRPSGGGFPPNQNRRIIVRWQVIQIQVRHMWVNFHKQFKNKDLNDLVWIIAKSSTMAEFNANMERMKRKNETA
ncbi:uncharacterized protein G2W53_027339 [Senna tora]|uniref:Uncharacterized protein n=1 Tax=Senna tora TaxID=362788 RepID=A0A834WM55_9FABA|nr:uncharacterized protein G2W53_027339 [Senna tora]